MLFKQNNKCCSIKKIIIASIFLNMLVNFSPSEDVKTKEHVSLKLCALSCQFRWHKLLSFESFRVTNNKTYLYILT